MFFVSFVFILPEDLCQNLPGRSLLFPTGPRGHTREAVTAFLSFLPLRKMSLSGYFDLTQTDCRPSRIASMTCPGLWLPVRQTLSRFFISRADPDRHRQPAPKRNLQFITCLTATGSYRLFTCFPEQILSYHNTLSLFGQRNLHNQERPPRPHIP